MSEQDTTTTTTTDTGSDPASQQGQPDAGKTFTQADVERIVEDRLIRERKRFADYNDLKKRAAAAMTEQERAVAEAEQRGKATAIAESAARLARAEFRATAAGRLDKETLDAYLEDVDLKRFIREDGEPDTKAIEARITKLAGSRRAPDFDGGARATAGRPVDMNARIRQLAGLG